MSSSRLIRRLLRAKPMAGPISRPADIPPPAPWGQADSVWQQLRSWLSASADKTPRSQRQLLAAREDCAQALADMHDSQSHDLTHRCHHARSLREIWHLRAEVYSLVARHHSQGEADRRLQTINRHYTDAVASPRNTSLEHPHA